MDLNANEPRRNPSAGSTVRLIPRLILRLSNKVFEIPAGTPEECKLEVGVLERRTARRFNIGWDVTVTANDGTGSMIGETGTLENLSSNGAFLFLTRNLDPGTRVEVRIRVPFNRENWMKYSGEVVRSEKIETRVGIAMRFDSARPTFEVM